MRNFHVDAVRGYCLVGMTINHAHPFILGDVFVEPYGFVSAAEGFIFLSGFVAGLYYLGLADRRGEAAMTKRALRRARDIYLTHLALFISLLGAAALIFPQSLSRTHEMQRYYWFMTSHPLKTMLLGALLLYRPNYFEILPFYTVMIALVPPMVRLWKAGRAFLLLCLSACLWLLSQPQIMQGWKMPAWLDLGHFNILGWQFVFVCGLLLGCLHRKQPLNSNFGSPKIFVIALSLAGLLLILRHAGILLGARHIDLYRHYPWLVAKQSVAPLRLVDFGLIAYVLAQLFIWYGPWMETTWLHRWLRYLGQHSLQVFAWSILVVFAVPFMYHYLGIVARHFLGIAAPNSLSLILTLIGVASLVIPARVHAIYREQQKRRPGTPDITPPPNPEPDVSPAPNA